jgi:hypothetical protein
MVILYALGALALLLATLNSFDRRLGRIDDGASWLCIPPRFVRMVGNWASTGRQVPSVLVLSLLIVFSQIEPYAVEWAPLLVLLEFMVCVSLAAISLGAVMFAWFEVGGSAVVRRRVALASGECAYGSAGGLASLRDGKSLEGGPGVSVGEAEPYSHALPIEQRVRGSAGAAPGGGWRVKGGGEFQDCHMQVLRGSAGASPWDYEKK